MILYQAATDSQLMRCMVHRINYCLNEKAILVYPIENRQLVPHVCKMLSQKRYKKFFDEIYYFDFQGIGYREKDVKKNADAIYHRDVPYELNEFSEIIISTPQFPLACYMAHKKMPFSYMEESIGAYEKQKKDEIDYKRAWPNQYEWGMKYGIFDLSNRDLIRRIYAEQSDDVADERNVWFNFLDEYYKLPEELRIMIKELFGQEFKLSAFEGGYALLISEAYANGGFLSLKDEINLYKDYLDYFAYPRHVIIKPHPSDMLNYKKIIPHVKVISKDIPLELVEDVRSLEDCLLLGFNSSVEKSIYMKKKLRFCKDFYKRIPEVRKSLPKVLIIKEMYDYLAKFCPLHFSNAAANDPLVDNFFQFVQESVCGLKVLFVNMGDDVAEEDVLAYFNAEDTIIVFKELPDRLLHILYEYKDGVIRKKIKITMDDSGVDDRIEYLYIYTRNRKAQKLVGKFHYKKWMYYSKSTIEVMNDDAQEMRGKLDVEERYLSLLKEENEVMIMDLN